MTVAVITAFGGRADAQGDTGGAPAPADAPATAPASGDPTSGDAMPAAAAGVEAREEVRFGAGIRIRSVHIPKALLELFVERAGTSVNGVGFGLELYRRKGDFELQVGFEYEKLKGNDGIWVDKGESIPADDPDFVEFQKFGWVTFEVTFLNHTKLADFLALRYGGGAGIGVLLGDVVRTDYHCTTASYDSCSRAPLAENDQTPYDLPPVFPVINAIIGLQIRPLPSLVINVEGGIRTIPFFGGTVGYYF